MPRRRGHTPVTTQAGALLVPTHVLEQRENEKLRRENEELRRELVASEADIMLLNRVHHLDRQIDRIGFWAVDLGVGKRLHERLIRDGAHGKLLAYLHKLTEHTERCIEDGLYPPAMRQPTTEVIRAAHELANCTLRAELDAREPRADQGASLVAWIKQNGTKHAQMFLLDMRNTRGGSPRKPVLDALYTLAWPYYEKVRQESAKYKLVTEAVWHKVSTTPDEQRSEAERLVFIEWTTKKIGDKQRRDQVATALEAFQEAYDQDLEEII